MSDRNDEHALRRLRLARVYGLGPRGAALIESKVGFDALFDEPVENLLKKEVPSRYLEALRSTASVEGARRELDLLASMGASLLVRGGPGYPASLDALHDPPQTLSVLGALNPEDVGAVAIVGSRRATFEGREIAREIARDLAAAGVTVVSGLARGIDRAAHEGALEAGGRTLAVLGSGLRCVWPVAHAALARRIALQGAVLSELAPDEKPRRHTFPQRNRIVAGLSAAVLVVQAGPRSGALITADLALSEGRDLFAVPGSIREPLSRGPHQLLRDGATLVESAQDVLDVLQPTEIVTAEVLDLFAAGRALARLQAAGSDPPAPDPLTPTGRVLQALARGALPTEDLVSATALPADAVMTALGRLELDGQVAVELGGAWRRVG